MSGAGRLVHNLKLSHLRLIAAIDRHRQIVNAAQSLGITQPAASRSLAEIERMVGSPLFDRHPRGMTATPSGEIFARRARHLLTGLTDLDRELDEAQGGLTGTVRVGAVTGPALACVVPALARLKAAAPLVEVTVEVEPSGRLLAALEDGDLDFLLARIPPGHATGHLRVEPALREAVQCLVRATHPLATRRALAMADLAPFPWVLQDRGAPIRQAVELSLAAEGLAPPADVTTSASQMLALALAAQTDAICPMAHEVARLFANLGAASDGANDGASDGVHDGPINRHTANGSAKPPTTTLSTGGLAALDLARPIELSPCHLVSLSSRQLSPATERLLTLIRAEIASGV